MLSSCVFANQNLPPIGLVDSCGATRIPFPSRDENPVTTTPLVSAFTNCDARNPFRMRIYENCRVSYDSPAISPSRLTFPRKQPFCKSLVFYSLRTLPSSVSRKPFICHSYENCRVYINNSHSETYSSPLDILALSFRSLCPSVCPPGANMLGFPLEKSPGPCAALAPALRTSFPFVSLRRLFGAERLSREERGSAT
jgi:hypothetical protein